MSVLRSKNFLSTLIKTGADASLNLYTVSFRPYKNNSSLYNSLLSLRTVTAPTLVTRDLTTTEINYQNITVPVINPGSSITKTQSFTIRVDNKYKVLSLLRNNQCLDENGDFFKDENKKFEITVDALAPKMDRYSSEEYETVYRWIFRNCYITQVSPLSYDYESAGQASINVTFIWESYSETAIGEEDSNNYVTGQDVTNSLFSQLKNKINSI